MYSFILDIGEAAWHIMHTEPLSIYYTMNFIDDDNFFLTVIDKPSIDDPGIINFWLRPGQN